jgi:hypothetical protein
VGRVARLERTSDEPVTVYNLEVEGPNTFFVGKLAVHNKGGGGFSGGGRSSSVSSGSTSRGSSSSSSGSSSWGGGSGSGKSTPSTPTQSTGSSWGAKGGSTGSGSGSTVASNRSTIMTQQKAANLKAQAVETKNFTSKTTSTDWKASQSKFSSGKVVYTPKVGTHTQDSTTRTTVYNRYYNTSPYGGYCYADPFNHSMIWMFSTMWWYHNWNQVDRELYKDDLRMKELEKEIEKLKAQNIKVDPNYRDPGMDEAVMYNEGYLQAVKDGKITDKTYVADKPEEEKHWYSCFISSLID